MSNLVLREECREQTGRWVWPSRKEGHEQGGGHLPALELQHPLGQVGGGPSREEPGRRVRGRQGPLSRGSSVSLSD